jgi:hypothetical protein
MSLLQEPYFLADGFSQRRKAEEREDSRDHDVLHGSDLSKCAREVWARRNHKPKVRADDNTWRKWNYGLDFEKRVMDAIYARPEYAAGELLVNYQMTVVSFMGGEILGHPDFILEYKGEKQVIEVKTTTFFPKQINGKRVRIPDKDAMLSYRIQAAVYAMAVQAPTFRVIVCCRESGMMKEYVYNTADYVSLVLSRYKLMTETTAQGMPEPVKEQPMADTFNVRDGKSWACRYCAHALCERNENPSALDLVEIP